MHNIMKLRLFIEECCKYLSLIQRKQKGFVEKKGKNTL